MDAILVAAIVRRAAAYLRRPDQPNLQGLIIAAELEGIARAADQAADHWVATGKVLGN